MSQYHKVLISTLLFLSGCSLLRDGENRDSAVKDRNVEFEYNIDTNSDSVPEISSFYGFADLCDIHLVKNVYVYGAALFHNVVAIQDIHVNGDLEAYDTNIDGNLFLNGAAILIDSTVKGKVDVNGTLKAVETTLTEIEASTDEISLTNSSIMYIKLRKPAVADQAQKIILNGTVVSGDIVFEKEGGEVILRDGSNVQGKIIGGLIVAE